MTSGLNPDQENGMFAALHDEDCGEIDGSRIHGALVLGKGGVHYKGHSIRFHRPRLVA